MFPEEISHIMFEEEAMEEEDADEKGNLSGFIAYSSEDESSASEAPTPKKRLKKKITSKSGKVPPRHESEDSDSECIIEDE